MNEQPRFKDIFDQAVEIESAEECERFLNEACDGRHQSCERRSRPCWTCMPTRVVFWNRRRLRFNRPWMLHRFEKRQAALSAATSCSNRSVKAVLASSSWRSSRSRFVDRWH